MTVSAGVPARDGGNRVRLRLDLAQAATPRLLKHLPRHRWFFFPHSYSPALVEAILDHAGVPPRGTVLDPFAGAGTTLLVARSRGLTALGLDLSPLAVLASNVKVRDYDPAALESALATMIERARHIPAATVAPSPRLPRAFSAAELDQVLRLRAALERQPPHVRDFLLLALLSTAHEFSRATPDGGWFRWIERPSRSWRVFPAFSRRVHSMIEDIRSDAWPPGDEAGARALLGDARSLKGVEGRFDLVLTSPPYPNRHDYTRVFHIDLLLLGETEGGILDLRHRSLRSHVEAHALAGCDNPRSPDGLASVLALLPAQTDRRVVRMLQGYFDDLQRTLTRLRSHVRPGGMAAFVVGQVRHAGILVPVDDLLAETAETAGWRHTETWALRERGNSAQQMGRFGRVPARESIVFLEDA